MAEFDQNVTAGAVLIDAKNPTTWFSALPGNKVLPNLATTGLSPSLFLIGRPTFILGAISELKGVNLPTTLPVFFTKTTFVGAFNDTDWTTGWAEFNPQTAVYGK